MNDQFVATVLLYLVPLFALLVTWKKPLSKALGWIAASEILGLLLFLPLYALVGLLGWEWYSWGGVSLQEILAYWQGIACTQDKPNPLTAQVSQPGELLRYVTDLLPNQLDGMGETG